MTEDEKRTINESQVKIQTIFFFFCYFNRCLALKIKKKSQTENHDNKQRDLLMSEIDVVNVAKL